MQAFRPAECCINRVAAAALMFLLGIGTVSGQSDQTESVLDRVVPEQPNGGPFALTSLVPNWSDGAALSVARAAGIVIGFEVAPDVKEVGTVATQEIAARLKARAERDQRVSLAGKTVREALDTIVAIDPRYRWIDVHGVPVVRPWASWTDPRHPLNQVVAPIVWPEIDLATALSNVSALVSGAETSGLVPGSGRGPVFALRTGPIAVMELLNAIGVAHGGPVSWHMRHRCTIADPRAIYFILRPTTAISCGDSAVAAHRHANRPLSPWPSALYSYTYRHSSLCHYLALLACSG